jgi:hypothetical protein
MGDALRRLFLGLGVALGLAPGQHDPSLYARLYLAEDQARGASIQLDARIEDAFAPGALELVETGTRVALRYSASIEAQSGRIGAQAGPDAEASETRELWYDMRSSRYGVAFDGGKTAALVDPQAARNLASELRGLRLCGAGEASPGTRVGVRAEIGIIDSRGQWHHAPVLWNYVVPRAVLSVGGKK